MFSKSKINYLEKQYYNKTEQQFYNLYHYYPDEIYIMLLSMGFSSKAFEPIQKEMDRLFQIQKIQSEFFPLESISDISPF